eukprot:gene1716-4470_t
MRIQALCAELQEIKESLRCGVPVPCFAKAMICEGLLAKKIYVLGSQWGKAKPKPMVEPDRGAAPMSPHAKAALKVAALRQEGDAARDGARQEAQIAKNARKQLPAMIEK